MITRTRIALAAAALVAASLATVLVPAAPASAGAVFSPDTAVVGYETGADADVEALVASLGGEVVANADAVRFMVVRTDDPGRLVAELEGAAGVRYAERDPLIFPEHTPNDQFYPFQWGLPAIKADKAWDHGKGLGAVVAVLDTGVEWRHNDLILSTAFNLDDIPGNRLDDDRNGYVDDFHGWDFSSNDNEPNDCSGHGTHVAGIVGATQDNLLGVSGVAPQSKVMPLSVLCRGNHLAAAALAVVYAAENGANVVTCSWYAWFTLTAFEEAVAWAYAEKNVLFVKSAGNQNGGPVTYPGNLPEYIAVSSLDSSLALSSFSSVGPKVELSAPGRGISSTYIGNSYASLSGTSMAAPHVAGTAALVFAAKPGITNVEVRDILTSTARDLGDPGRDIRFGHGIVDAEAAVKAALGVS